jgi:plasmid stability protein
MPSFTLKNIPEDLYARLRASAAEHRRSINQEALVRLEEALAARRADPEALLRRADRLRRRLRVRPLTDRALREARDRGRP